jgi:hypothetical protein
MDEHIHFSGLVQGVYYDIQIYPVADQANHYSIHWCGFKVGIIKKSGEQWFTEDPNICELAYDIGNFIDQHHLQK